MAGPAVMGAERRIAGERRACGLRRDWVVLWLCAAAWPADRCERDMRAVEVL